MNTYLDPEEQRLLCTHLIDQVSLRTSGRANSECERNFPRDVYFVGCLRSEDVPPEEAEAHLPELLNKLAPVAFGAEFKITPAEGASLKVCLRWSCYYRVFPTRQQQLQHFQGLSARRSPGPIAAARDAVTGGAAARNDGDDTDVPDETAFVLDASVNEDTSSSRARNDVLMPRFRKVECLARGHVTLNRSADGWSTDSGDLMSAIAAETTRAAKVVSQDSESVRTGDDPYPQLHVPEAALHSDAVYDAFKRMLRKPVVPDWRWDTRVDVRADADAAEDVRISILFANKTLRQFSNTKREHPCLEAYLFDARAAFNFHSCLVKPFTVELAPKGFRYDRNVWSRPFNCAVERVPTGTSEFETTHVPVFAQPRLQPQAAPAAPFAELAADPAPILDTILAAMEAYREEWRSAGADYLAHVPDWTERHISEFNADLAQFEEEIGRFKAGRDLIANDADVRSAFRLTNETFARSGSHTGKSGWRLFQIVFLVSQIPGLAALAAKPGSVAADLRRADIIYFPTGGGKTEAYLSTIAFHCFFDRLRGKAAGVTAWTRFPLRLLTLQQTQRVADVICVADVVRREQSDPRLSGPNVAGFGVG